jgi:hypothetical protein
VRLPYRCGYALAAGFAARRGWGLVPEGLNPLSVESDSTPLSTDDTLQYEVKHVSSLLMSRACRWRQSLAGLVLGLAVVFMAARPASADLAFTMPQTLTELAGGTVTVPVMLTNTTNATITVEDFQFAVAYNNNQTTTPFTVSSIVLGPADSGFTVNGINTLNPGVFLISVQDNTFAGFAIAPHTTATIVDFNLTSAANSTTGPYVINLLSTFTTNGGTFQTGVDNTAGHSVTLTPIPVNNSSSTPGPSDGLVTILPSVAVPEPGTMAFVGVAIGLAGLRLAWSRRRRLTDVG